MSANIRETKIAFGYKIQSDLQTANIGADMLSLTKVNASLANVDLKSEDDGADIGKGDEFPTQNFLTNWDVSGSIEKYISSEFMAWLFCFGLGKTTKTTPAAGAYQYVCVPQPPVTDDIDLKPFTFYEAIRPGGSAVIDRAAVGCVVTDWSLMLSSGPGRANSKATVNFASCGKVVQPSTITAPAVTAEHFLNAGGAGITINGTDYIAGKSFVECEITGSNNPRLDEGFFPGSGVHQGAAIRGRMEFGDRSYGLRYKCRFKSGSTEAQKMLDQTEGSAVISLTGALITGSTYHSAIVNFPRVVFNSAVVGDSNGLVTIEVGCKPLKHPSNGIVTMTAICGIDNILSLAA